MFRRSKQKIVAVIMAVIVFLLAGTLCVIYGASYIEVYRQNQDMLAHHIALYENHDVPDLDFRPDEGLAPAQTPNFDHEEAFQLSTFYSVLLSPDGDVMDAENTSARYSDDELVIIAQKVRNEKEQGVSGSLLYRYKAYGEYILVAFMDNAVMQESITTLFRYTLILGGIAIIVMFFFARIAAQKIVQPLEESYQKQKQFISDAGHELKTPISVVSANAEMIERQVGTNQWLANIQHENIRMGRLVMQLLELARTEQVVSEKTEIDFSHLVLGETLPFETVAFERGLTLESDISENICITGNAQQLAQLVSILIDNGIRHSADGGAVTVSLMAEKGNAVLSVRNMGNPIPAEKQKYLFERFYRVDEARNGEENHYGLGLAIAKSIVTVHGGTIRVCCQDKTIEFSARLPLL